MHLDRSSRLPRNFSRRGLPAERAARTMSGLDDAVRLLSTASTDEERFVGLLLASKVAAEPAELRAVFDASSAFVRRLLRSPPPAAADGGGGNPYRSLALSVLASFATDAPTAARPEFLEVALEAAATLGDAAAAAAEWRDAAAVVAAALEQPGGLAEAVRARLVSLVLVPAATAAGSAAAADAAAADADATPGTRTCRCCVPRGGGGGALVRSV